ncbi:GLUG motif-containing protein [uncultured Intestinimonas sp.]|uniref:GLUG motif-containing protein n=1 Tax=uncultured Intestinimonas sp. TaxID=1689265 RepID=UPI0025F1335B|nr:GLUG motif-containing protein [uncultured Intestinimonas sp.]
MKRKISRSLSLLLAAVMLLSLIAPAALAAGSADAVYLRTAEDLVNLSQKCTLDSWSQGKTVYLEADIDLTGVDFAPIPTFGGTFEGRGHTISGLYLTGSGDVRGLFRYIQPTGAVGDLHVTGTISPTGRKNTLGGLAGENHGTITNCSFSGAVSGTDSIGGIAGINEARGQIINCAFSGSVTGEHYVGGIAGQNYGSIIQCENKGSIDTTEVAAELDLEELDREQLNAVENVPVCTDIGGITGFSSGILQGCVNTGAVGYAHVGYNVGGIVGRQSGYLNGCANSGTILGRKDVGGIAGQLVPEVRLLYNEGRIGDLLDELDVLRELIDRTGDDVRGASDALSERMQAISDRAGEAQEAMSDLMDSTTDWANEDIGEINDLSARLSWLTDELDPIMDGAADAMDRMEELSGQLNDVMDEAQEAGGLAPDAADQFADAIEDLGTAARNGRNAVEHLKAAMAHLRDVLGRPELTAEAIQAVADAAVQLADALSAVSDAIVQAVTVWAEAGGADRSDEEIAALGSELAAVRSSLEQAKDAAQALGAAAAKLVLPTVHPEEWEAARQEAEAAGESLAAATRTMASAISDSADAVRQLRELLEQAGDAMEELREAGDTIEELSSLASGISADLSDVLHELSEMPTITIRPISSEIQEQGDALGDIFSDLLDDGDALRESMSSSTDILLDDLEAINEQFGVITGLLRDILDAPDGEAESRFEDVSDEAPETTDTGHLSDARNDGTVEGDIDVAGVVGSMAIEYDFDPEDDLIREGDRSLDFRYQAKAVVSSCVNTGEITGKQDCAGGIVGLMDLGRVSGCENYGDVSSTNGGHVGGIAGASWGSIRDSWSKCRLSGGDYVGGVAGLGATLVNCHTLVTIDEGAAYLGAVAGDVDSGGTVSGNTFTSEELGALDGISYAGKAEPVDLDTLCSTEGVPEFFSQLELTFVADGATVAVIPFQYGAGIAYLPEIPAKKGCSAAWPDLDYTHLTASQTLEAEYTPYTSALTDGGELPEILVDGSFSSRAAVTHTAEEISWRDGYGVRHTGTAYTVAVDDPDLEQVSYTVHYRLPDPERRYVLWVWGESGWSQAEHEIDGRYLLLKSQAEEVTFCITERSAAPSAWVAAGAVGLLFLAVIFCAARHARKKRR